MAYSLEKQRKLETARIDFKQPPFDPVLPRLLQNQQSDSKPAAKYDNDLYKPAVYGDRKTYTAGNDSRSHSSRAKIYSMKLPRTNLVIAVAAFVLFASLIYWDQYVNGAQKRDAVQVAVNQHLLVDSLSVHRGTVSGQVVDRKWQHWSHGEQIAVIKKINQALLPMGIRKIELINSEGYPIVQTICSGSDCYPIVHAELPDPNMDVETSDGLLGDATQGVYGENI